VVSILISFDFILKKGSDNVNVCKYLCTGTSCRGTVENYYNDGKSPRLLDGTNPSLGISNPIVSYVNGRIKCSFRRQNKLPNVANYFDTTSMPYFFLTANGKTIDSQGK
jgi:hypothetical protein